MRVLPSDAAPRFSVEVVLLKGGRSTCGVDYLEIFDAEHSLEEERFICIGPITRGIVVRVTVDVDTDVIRIISARVATRRESRLCEHYLEERSHGRRPF